MSGDDTKVTKAPAKRPGPRRLRDMALSMAVLLVPLGIFYWGWDWASGDREVTVADTSDDRRAAEGLGMDVIEPELSDRWRPISSAVDTGDGTGDDTVTLRTGWYSPEGLGLQVVQTTGTAEEADEDLSGSGEPQEAAGVTWRSYEVPSGLTWVADLAESTVLIVAEPDAVDELPELAEGVVEAAGS